MNCKNCNGVLRTDHVYCPKCGAKKDVYRITLGALAADLTDRVFSLDSSFVRTFKGLFVRPEKVIVGYLEGVRKKYLNPISYMAIALTLSGLLVFVMQKYYKDAVDFTGGAGEINPAFSEKWSNLIFDFNAFFFIIYLPVLALPAYLLLNKAKFNFAEYLVVFIYIMAHYSLVSFPLSFTVLVVDAEHYVSINQPMLLVTLVYTLFVLQRINRYRTGPLIGRSAVFLAMVVILFFGMILVLMGVLLLTGYLELDDFKPVETAQAISSSARNWASYNLL